MGRVLLPCVARARWQLFRRWGGWRLRDVDGTALVAACRTQANRFDDAVEQFDRLLIAEGGTARHAIQGPAALQLDDQVGDQDPIDLAGCLPSERVLLEALIG